MVAGLGCPTLAGCLSLLVSCTLPLVQLPCLPPHAQPSPCRGNLEFSPSWNELHSFLSRAVRTAVTSEWILLLTPTLSYSLRQFFLNFLSFNFIPQKTNFYHSTCFQHVKWEVLSLQYPLHAYYSYYFFLVIKGILVILTLHQFHIGMLGLDFFSRCRECVPKIHLKINKCIL